MDPLGDHFANPTRSLDANGVVASSPVANVDWAGMPTGIAMVTLATDEVAKNLTEIADIVGGYGDIVTGRAGELIECVSRPIDL